MRSSTSLLRGAQVVPWSPPDLSPRRVPQPDASVAVEAVAEAERILEQARQQARILTEAARQEGRRAGEAEVRETLAAARAVYQEVQAWRERVLAQSERQVIDMVLAVARQMFGDGLELPPEVLQRTVARALEAARPLGSLRIHLHPSDVQRLEPAWLETQAAGQAQEMVLVPDESVRPGGCFIEGERGSVDARVETQLQRVAEALQATPVPMEAVP